MHPAPRPDVRERQGQERGDAEREPGLVADRVGREGAEEDADDEGVGRDPRASPAGEAHGAERPQEQLAAGEPGLVQAAHQGRTGGDPVEV